ncbi:signal transduction histidine kinase [Stackebrandtia albiflava]|uniref:histidine kinase n=1 Tax=Stackebrandtia albiflava TaxID=406432 RepID=A0A562UQE5_9ACTN|nr:signal transduction histidine kinase [Stackebrandtia albiflava]
MTGALWWIVLTLPAYGLMSVPGGVEAGFWQCAAVAIGVGVALWLRRRLPIGALLAVVTLATWGSVEPLSADWQPFMLVSTFVLSYLVGRTDDTDYPLMVHLGAMSAMVLLLVPILGIGLLDSVMLTVVLVFTIVFPWLGGRYLYQRALLATSGWERAKQLEREQRAVAEQVRLRERTRIAEDMHDSLGHELSLIALRAAALEVDAALPGRQQQAAGELRRSAAAATERLREIIGLLRDETDAASMVPADESIADLVERTAESGMTVRLHSTGTGSDVPKMVERAGYRVVQEALTNAAKHAPGLPVTVTVDMDAERTRIGVSNPSPAQRSAGIGGGRGLVGLTERVRLAGGRFRATEHSDRFEVVAELPHTSEGPGSPGEETESESVQEHDRATRLTRRRLVTVFAIPIVLLMVLGLVSVSVYLLFSFYSVLPPAVYRDLEIGDSRRQVDGELPVVEMLDPPEWATPAGMECVYHPSANELDTFSDVYQLCFVDDVLVSKDVVTVEERMERLANSSG